jgi:TPR repeat protein
MSTWVDLFIVGAPSASIVIVGIVCGTFLHILKCHPEWVKRILGFCQKHGVKLEGKFGSAALSLSMEKMSAMGQDDSPDAPKQTLEELKKAAEKGDAEAQYNLGVAYERGDGVPQDYEEAAAWFHKAAEQGHMWAQGLLGMMYYEGRGVAQDDARAAHWHRKAAEQGLAGAQGILGLMYYEGRGVAQDYVQAYVWLNLAAADKWELAKDIAKWRDEVKEVMSVEAIAEGQRLSRTLAERIKKEKADRE